MFYTLILIVVLRTSTFSQQPPAVSATPHHPVHPFCQCFLQSMPPFPLSWGMNVPSSAFGSCAVISRHIWRVSFGGDWLLLFHAFANIPQDRHNGIVYLFKLCFIRRSLLRADIRPVLSDSAAADRETAGVQSIDSISPF